MGKTPYKHEDLTMWTQILRTHTETERVALASVTSAFL